MVTDRSLQVLHAIVTDYVAHREPVASKSLTTRHPFGVSAATIRNDMVALEEAGLIIAPHTSSGRVPTDRGFRLYVDTLTKVQPLSPARRAAIERFLGEAHDFDEAMARTTRLLSQLTNQVALVQYPAAQSANVRHIDLVPVSENRIVCVVITSSGAAPQQTLLLPHNNLPAVWVAALRDRIAAAVVGVDIELAIQQLEKLSATLQDALTPEELAAAQIILAAVQQQLLGARAAKIAVSGTANLSRQEPGSTQTAAVLDALEEQVTLLQLLNELALDRDAVSTSIGVENERFGLAGTAVVATSFAAGDDAQARLGVLGPVTMDYAGNIAAVRAVASYLSKMLG